MLTLMKSSQIMISDPKEKYKSYNSRHQDKMELRQKGCTNMDGILHRMKQELSKMFMTPPVRIYLVIREDK